MCPPGDEKPATYFPAAPTHGWVVRRPRLEALVRDAKVVIAVAPAGYSKSTFSAQWAQSRIAAGYAVIGLDLTEAHRDPYKLLQEIRNRTRRAEETKLSVESSDFDPHVGQEALFAATLDALGKTPSWLILNDLHTIEASPAFEYIERLVHAVTADFRLFLTSRTAPALALAQLASRNEVCWISERQLAFTAEEVRAVAARYATSLPTATLEMLALGSNGWPILVCVALAALRDTPALANTLDIGGLAAQGMIRALVRELLRDVVENADVLAMLEILVALETVPQALLAALVPHFSNALLLTEATGLIHVSQDSAGVPVYQLHPVVREIVAQEFVGESDKCARIQQRAGQWYWSRHQPDQAIREALAANDVGAAANWLDSYAGKLVRQLGLLETFLRYLELLPKTVLQAYPMLVANQAWALVLLRRYVDAEAPINALQTSTEIDGQNAAKLLRGVQAALQDDMVLAFKLLAESEATLSGWPDFERGAAAIVLGFCHKARGDFVAAHRVLQVAKEAFESLHSSYGQSWTAASTAVLLLKEGRWRNALSTCRTAILQCGGHTGVSPQCGMLYAVEALVLYERNDLAAAREAVDESLRLLHQQGIVDVIIAGYVAAARIEAAQDNFSDALDLLAEGERIGGERRFVRLEETLRAERILLLIRNGQTKYAESLAYEAGLLPLDTAMAATALRQDKCVRIAARLASRGMVIVGLIPHLHNAISHARTTGQRYKLAELLIQLALIAAHDDDVTLSRQALGEALALAMTEGYVRMFVDEGEMVAALLRKFSTLASVCSGAVAAHLQVVLQVFEPQVIAKKAVTPDAINRLSGRELQVLSLVAQGYANSVIAGKMFLTEGTVKWHLHNIYGKLSVSSRTAAVMAAQQSGLLASPQPPLI